MKLAETLEILNARKVAAGLEVDDDRHLGETVGTDQWRMLLTGLDLDVHELDELGVMAAANVAEMMRELGVTLAVEQPEQAIEFFRLIKTVAADFFCAGVIYDRDRPRE